MMEIWLNLSSKMQTKAPVQNLPLHLLLWLGLQDSLLDLLADLRVVIGLETDTPLVLST
jgi:hypothetical protein